MYHIKNDQRAIRSSRVFYDTLAQLMQDQPFDTITVTQLVAVAQLGRATFYRNFDKIEDIFQMRCDQVVDDLIVSVIAYKEENRSQEPGKLLKPMLRYFYLNSEIIDLLLRANRIDILQDSFRKRAQWMRSRIAQLKHLPEEYVDYGAEIRISVMLTIVTHWVKSGKRQAPDELADKLKSMIKNWNSQLF